MKTKLFIATMLVVVGALFAGCTKEGGKGRSTVEIPGVPGGFDETFLYMQSCGESSIEGVWATNLAFQINASDGRRMHISAMTFHRGEAFATGTYTFPSTDAGTASGTVQLVSNDHQNILSGYITAGSATIGSGKEWTVTFSDVVLQLEDGSQKSVSFTYKGLAEKEDISGWMSGRGPEYGVSSTVEDAIGGEKFSRLGMRLDYNGPTESGLHDHLISLVSNVHTSDGVKFDLHFYTSGRELKPGTYTANTGEAGSVEGRTFRADFNGEVIDGSVTLAVESNGMYRLTLNDLCVGEIRVDLNGEVDGTRLAKYTGAWTGGCQFYDNTLDPAYPPFVTEPQYGGTTTFQLPGGVPIDGLVKAGGYVISSNDRIVVLIDAFVLPAQSSTTYSQNNRVSLQFNLIDSALTPGTYTYADNIYETGKGSFDMSMTYPVFDESGAIVGNEQAFLIGGILTVRQSGNVWELELSDTVTNNPNLPTFDGAYIGRIGFIKD